MIGYSNDETNFTYKLLLTNTQVLRFFKALSSGSSVNIKLSKCKLPITSQSGKF